MGLLVSKAIPALSSGDIIDIISRPTVVTFFHASKYEVVLIRKSDGGGLAAERTVARRVRRISVLSSAMAVDVCSAKYS